MEEPEYQCPQSNDEVDEHQAGGRISGDNSTIQPQFRIPPYKLDATHQHI